ncbi:hypothetical protein BYT27DRAFT_7095067 [Phlegmacium glaucopus]|nr:hypothetical protein BYT27DRAFT_7095067 [Phlegmacium glaucopus]
MFEDICLVCGKPLQDVGRAYCSDDCQTSDISSPSISSSSSARSSPNMSCTYGDEVPPLVPSALGSALKSYMGRSGYHLPSSSASSASWTLLTDDEDDEAIRHFGSDHDVFDGIYDGNSKSASGLSYARRPSGINNSSTVPHLHRRMCSDSSCGPVRGIPRSVPIYSHSLVDDDENYFGTGSLPEDALDTDDNDLLSEQDWYRMKPKYQGVKTSKRSRNRASLPACFSLLQMTSSKDNRSSPVLSSSGNTIARPSPPTPKLTLLDNTLSQAQFPPTVYTTPRGRRREVGNSPGSRRSVNPSASGSRSRTTSLVFGESPRLGERSFRSRTDLKGSTEQLFDWSSVPGFPHRGRATLRRNSSPLPKMHLGPALVFDAAVRSEQEAERSASTSRSRARTRGRARVEDLGRDAHSTEAPGFGYGRSGLLNRERGSGVQSTRLPF